MSSQATEETIFRTNDDYLVWENYVRRCDTLPGLSASEKQAAKDSLTYLQRIFGDRFLRRAYEQRESRNPHPLIQMIMMQAAWSRLWLIRFAKALESVRSASNFKGLLKRLKNGDRFAEGESVLEVAGPLLNVGFEISFEPEVAVTGHDGKVRLKKPDIKIASNETGEEAIVEVSLLGQSEGFEEAEKLTSFVMPLIFKHLSPAGLTMYAQLTEQFDKSRVKPTVEELCALIENVKGTGEFSVLENDCIVAGIANQQNLVSLNQWAEERGISKAISGPPVYSDEIARAITKIRDKLAQLPENLPGVIVISTTGSALFHRHSLDSILRTLADEIGKYPKLACVILSHGYFGGTGQSLPTALLGGHAIVSRTIGGLLNEQALLLINPHCRFSIGPLVNKLREAFVFSDSPQE